MLESGVAVKLLVGEGEELRASGSAESPKLPPLSRVSGCGCGCGGAAGGLGAGGAKGAGGGAGAGGGVGLLSGRKVARSGCHTSELLASSATASTLLVRESANLNWLATSEESLRRQVQVYQVLSVNG